METRRSSVNNSRNGKEKQSPKESIYLDVKAQLDEMNKKLESIMKNNNTQLKEMIERVFGKMKDRLVNRIELLEGKLLEKERENDELKTQITSLKENLQKQKDDNEALQIENKRIHKHHDMRINDAEQYN